ncbi:MAG: Ig-like domain-containing protein, partial [Erysipelotrichaceae bacterium]|nr:Ig-like domain-containing protein [Erysipelotrichaceae bacterium]
SSDESIAKVDENGTVTGVTAGDAVITVTAEDGGYTAELEVHVVVPAEGISVNEEESVSEIEFGNTGTIQITFEPADTTNQNLTWTSSDETVATVDENGVITAVGEGPVTITATSEDGGFTVSKEITIIYHHVERIELEEETIEELPGYTQSLHVSFIPENASNKNVTFTSDNEDVVTVDSEGKITCVSDGTAVITVTTEDGGKTAECRVRVILEDIYVKGLEPSYTYTGTAIKPAFDVYDTGVLLTPKTDYTITYKNNTKAYTLKEGDEGFSAKKAPQIIIKSNAKGNYKGSKTVYFTIDPVDLNDEQITVDELSVQATGKTLSPVPTVYFNGKKLKVKTDYTVSYGEWNRTDAGDYVITITGKENGNFSGTREVTVHVSPKEMISVAKLTVSSKAVKYADLTGNDFLNEIASALTVKNGKKVVPADSYSFEDIPADYKNVGTVKFTLVGKEEAFFYGKRTVTVKITGISLTDKKVKAVTGLSYPYTGEEIKVPEGTSLLSYGTAPLTEGTDYEIAGYAKNINAGTAAVTVKGINNYTGTKKVSFKITPITDPVDDARITIEEAFYSKGGSKPTVTIEGMTANTDYSLKYTKNTKADTEGTVTITFKGNYKGTPTITKQFYINPKDISTVSITSKDKVYSNKANAWKSAPVLKDTDGKALKAGTDYEKTVVYTTEADEELTGVIPAGTIVKVTVTGKGNYTGTVSTTYRILETGKDISKLTFKIANQEYTGSPVTIDEDDITSIKLGKKEQELVLGTDYMIVSYSNNINKGTAKVTFRGIGEYGGTKTVTFKIGQRNITDYWNGIRNIFSSWLLVNG